MEMQRSIDLRYKGQEYYLNVPIQGEISADLLQVAAERFHVVHKNTYGHKAPEEPVEIVNLRISAIGKIRRFENSLHEHTEDVISTCVPLKHRPVYFNGNGWVSTPIYRRSDLRLDIEIQGPVIVTQMDTTIIVEPGQKVHADILGNLIISMEG
jgi:N-methylhydantoinase A